MRLMIALMITALPAQAEMIVALLAPWDGVTVPAGQHCRLQDGSGDTPPMQVTGVPEAAVALRLWFNDLSYPSLAFDGGHGVVEIATAPGDVAIAALPGETDALPDGVRMFSAPRARGEYASVGYLPPCSGGREHVYAVTVTAHGADGVELARVKNVKLGSY
ncbi:hypothetical protein [Neogemmobacter tilapiae]|uniref:YbhB/YbcL family Raf kinase inhibitor-like protein n=1 Tax=Neogemmobacter tilapiae TaxID=875041 RepID=A0A918WPK9_9RHOB|nr:hypothetical protein [Gemmobacter tilapiae]GHC62296.1 hypothetical protein GCM10007315_27940 [Gemmobacter tilapiae]